MPPAVAFGVPTMFTVTSPVNHPETGVAGLVVSAIVGRNTWLRSMASHTWR